jgi:hypothetical protein
MAVHDIVLQMLSRECGQLLITEAAKHISRARTHKQTVKEDIMEHIRIKNNGRRKKGKENKKRGHHTSLKARLGKHGGGDMFGES